jgi:hypothetical protein
MTVLYAQLSLFGTAVAIGIVWAIAHKMLDHFFPDSRAVALGQSIRALIDHIAGQKIGDAIVHTGAEKIADLIKNHGAEWQAAVDKAAGSKVGDQIFAAAMDRVGMLMSGVVAGPVAAPVPPVDQAPAVTTTTTTTVPA